MIEFCVHEKHGGICEKTGTYCNLGACPYESLKEFAVVQHGQWIEGFDGCENTYECSKCHTPYILLYGTTEDNGYNFCPNCGARMDGK